MYLDLMLQKQWLVYDQSGGVDVGLMRAGADLGTVDTWKKTMPYLGPNESL
jgi:hypothetical protein